MKASSYACRLQLRPVVLTLALTACASAATTSVARPPALAHEQALVADRLFFGRALPTGGEVSDSAWSAFLLDVVTPRFPTGLTVWHAEGQWLDPKGALVREPTMVVELFHPRGAPADSVFERIATEYRRRFHQDAVLRSTAEVRTKLYDAGSAAIPSRDVDSATSRSSP